MKTIIAAAMFVFFSVAALCETTEKGPNYVTGSSSTQPQGLRSLGLTGVAYKSTFLSKLKSLYDFSDVYKKRHRYFETGSPKTVLFIVRTTTLSVGDAALKAHLEMKGNIVQAIPHNASLHPADLSGIDLIVMSQNITSSNIGEKYKNANVPIVVCSPAMLPNFGMTNLAADIDYGSLSGQSQLNFMANGHPAGSGLTGMVTLTNRTLIYQWGVPGADAVKIAHLLNMPDRFGIFLYEKFATLADGNTALHKRGFLWLANNAFPNLSPQGINAFDGMIEWALTDDAPPADNIPPSVPSGLVATEIGKTSIEMSWAPSTDNTGVAGYNVYVDGVKSNGEIIGGTSRLLTGLSPNTAYSIAVSAVDFSGNESGLSVPVSVITLNVDTKKILLIARDTVLASGDAALKAHIEQGGNEVVVVGQSTTVHPVNLAGIDLIMLVQNITTPILGTHYKNVNIPIIVFNPATLPNLGMTGNTSGFHFGDLSNQTQLNFIPTPHPADIGVSGVATVTTTHRRFQWGVPGMEAVKLAHIVGQPDRYGVFLYEKNTLLADNSVAANKRGFLWIASNTFSVLNTTGLSAFNKMLQWCLAVSGPEIDTVPPSVPQGLTVSDLDTTGYILNWQPATDNIAVTGYNLYVNGVKSSNSPVAATSNIFTGLLPNTTYSVRVSALDLAGNESAQSQALEVTTLPLKNILFIVGSTTLTDGDNAIRARLGAKGYALQLIDHTPELHPANTAGMDMVLISATVTSGNIVNTYKNSTLPVITFEPYMLDDMGMTEPTATVDYGDILNQTQLNFIAPTHPITLGLSGNITVNDPSRRYVWGVPGGQSFNLALIVGSPNRSGAFVYEQGATLVDNTVAVHKRGFLWLFDDAFTSLSASGLSIFDNMIEWGLGNLVVPDLIAPTVPTGLESSNITEVSLSLNWQPSTDNVGVTGYRVFINGNEWSGSPVTGTTATLTGLQPSTNYSITVGAQDAAGNESAQGTPLQVLTLPPPDVQAPTVPEGLAASGITQNAFNLSWQPSTDNVGVVGYDIYQNGVKINGAPVAATTFAVSGLTPVTTYQMTVVSIDGAGNASLPSTPLGVTTFSPVQPKTILFIVGSTTLSQGDNVIRNRLVASGYTVNMIAHTSSLHPANLSGIDLVLISASVAPGNITNKYKAANVPIIICEPNILGNMGMTGNTVGTHYGEIDNQTQLNFVNPSHPVSDGLSGLQSISTVERRFVWGNPNSNATTIARIAGSSNRAGIFMYNQGVLMPDNSLSLNKRGFMWLWDNTFFTATTTGQTVFDRMIQWGVGSLGTGDVQSPSIPAGLTATDVQTNTFTLNWQASTDNVGVSGYDVFRNGNKINTTPVTGTSFGVTLLQPNTTYQMSVRALDAAGNQSALSALLSVTTLPLPGSESFTMRTVIASQTSPWDIAWGPDNQIWYTERTAGRVSRVNIATGTKQVLLTLGSNMVQSAGQDGLMGMAIHPEFNTGKSFVYIAYTYQSLSTTLRTTRIQRYTFNSATQVLENPVTVLENIPGSNDHNAGRMTIGPDLKLYYSLGDMGAGQFSNTTRPNNAQVVNNLEGKVLRLNLETIGGSWIPTDNPFTDGGAKTAVFSLGHRNPQGLVWGNVSGQNHLYSTEHGPYSDDEINIISSGANYGWPQIIGFCEGNYNGRSTGGFTIVNEATNCSTLGSTQPIFSMYAAANPPLAGSSSTTWPTVAPSGMDFYGQTAIPNWQHSLLIAGLKSGSIIRLKLNTTGTAVLGDTIHYFRGMGRFRDVIVSPDGTKIYAACDNSGSTSGPTGGVVSTPPNPGSILEFSFNSGISPASMITIVPNEYENLSKDDKVQVYPNPAKGQLMVKIERWQEAREIVLVTVDGKPAKQTMVTALETRVSLDYLKAGLYILRINGKDGRNMGTEKVMVIK
jgi:glucose/arabinose dehydrogenase